MAQILDWERPDGSVVGSGVGAMKLIFKNFKKYFKNIIFRSSPLPFFLTAHRPQERNTLCRVLQ